MFWDQQEAVRARRASRQAPGVATSERPRAAAFSTVHPRRTLYDNSLSGSIPSELGSLSVLVSLSLYVNQLTGPIPSELGSISGMRSITTSFLVQCLQS